MGSCDSGQYLPRYPDFCVISFHSLVSTRPKAHFFCVSGINVTSNPNSRSPAIPCLVCAEISGVLQLEEWLRLLHGVLTRACSARFWVGIYRSEGFPLRTGPSDRYIGCISWLSPMSILGSTKRVLSCVVCSKPPYLVCSIPERGRTAFRVPCSKVCLQRQYGSINYLIS